MTKFECMVEWAVKNLTDEDVRNLEKTLDKDYSYTTWKEAKRMIIEDALDKVVPLVEFEGECASDYKTMYDYFISGGFEKDYFSAWLEGCSDYPLLEEIIEFCEDVRDDIVLWENLYELGLFEWVEEIWEGKN